jgi:cob(I)alamin adenosyltransferase
VHFEHASKAYDFALEEVSKDTDILICDEILNTLLFDLLEKKQIHELMGICRGRTELVMTGRTAPAELIELADYVTELRQIKHPYYRGFKARMGIEF